VVARRGPHPFRACRLLLAVAAVCLIPGFNAASAQDLDPLGDRISSAHFIVVDVDTGEVFAHRSAHEVVAIASLTKVFTTIEALERAPLDTPITTNSSDLFGADSTVMGFGPGETFTLEELIYGMMLPSGNDAAHAIARVLGAQPGDTDPEQSVGRFVGWMNERVANMGLTATHLVNPHGLGEPGHVSTAFEVAAFTRYAMRYPFFVEVIGTEIFTTRSGYTLYNTNKVLGTDSELIGGKTGYDDDSGWCLIQVYQRARTRVISVTLDGVAPDIWYQDNSILADFGFRQKNARIAAGTPIQGQLAAFRDPDAAVIQAFATSSASIGGAAGVAQAAPPAPSAAGEAVAEPTPGNSEGGGASSTVLIALVMALLVVGAGVLATSAIGGRRSPPADADADADADAED
jgi:D-alanyl-D-alanine carboxypeptidase